MLKKINILSVQFTLGNKREILEEVAGMLSKKTKGHYIVTPNPEMVVRAQGDTDFREALASSDLSLADGIGIMFAAQILGKEGLTRITGVDMVEYLCKLASDLSSKNEKKPVTVGFLGAGSGVAERTGKCLAKKYPGLAVSFVGEEWDELGFENAKKLLGSKDTKKLRQDALQELSNITLSSFPHIDILFIAFGFPKQEMFMYEKREKLSVTCMVGVGGAFDYISGDIKRAPQFIRDVGLEWVFRLITQPWRWRRQLALPRFLYLVLKQRFSSK